MIAGSLPGKKQLFSSYHTFKLSILIFIPLRL